MNQPAEFEFSVDEQYENEKGVFRVIAIQGDEMVIRWENGEEIRTEIDLQLRIAAVSYTHLTLPTNREV